MNGRRGVCRCHCPSAPSDGLGMLCAQAACLRSPFKHTSLAVGIHRYLTPAEDGCFGPCFGPGAHTLTAALRMLRMDASAASPCAAGFNAVSKPHPHAWFSPWDAGCSVSRQFLRRGEASLQLKPMKTCCWARRVWRVPAAGMVSLLWMTDAVSVEHWCPPLPAPAPPATQERPGGVGFALLAFSSPFSSWKPVTA